MSYFVEKDDKKIWYNQDGLIHRDGDLPAIEYKDGGKEWFVNGLRHRDVDPVTKRERPSCIHANGNIAYHRNGLLHRSDTDENGNSLPASVYHNGTSFWCVNGKYHRTDGFAIICKGKTITGHDWESSETWIKGKFIMNEEAEKLASSIYLG